MINLMNQLQIFQDELQKILEELKTSPEGYLGKRGKYYYHVIGTKEIGITNKFLTIRQLCRKKYLHARQKQIEYNLNLKPKNFDKFDHRTPRELIKSFPKAYQGFSLSYFYHPSIETWLKEPYEKHPYPPEEGYTTKSGVQVRSKSELMIATQLENYQIPYRYEAMLRVGNKKECPDFTIKSPFTAKTINWEHLGALHLADYIKKMNEKMDAYLAHGYKLNDTLIYTFEFQIKNINRIQKIIEEIIL